MLKQNSKSNVVSKNVLKNYKISKNYINILRMNVNMSESNANHAKKDFLNVRIINYIVRIYR
jgi:hypothetical protein